jgi:hypothetical protein
MHDLIMEHPNIHHSSKAFINGKTNRERKNATLFILIDTQLSPYLVVITMPFAHVIFLSTNITDYVVCNNPDPVDSGRWIVYTRLLVITVIEETHLFFSHHTLASCI